MESVNGNTIIYAKYKKKTGTERNGPNR